VSEGAVGSRSAERAIRNEGIAGWSIRLYSGEIKHTVFQRSPHLTVLPSDSAKREV
jgi:hypothetical protein